MLKDPQNQGSFYDAEYLCEQLVPPDSFYRKFKDLVAPLIKDQDFESMYCKDNGRPPISPSLMAMATILQFYRGFSDREMEAACMFDIQIKYALGLKLDERPFDHSSLGDFRERMLKNGKEKAIFERILEHLIAAGLVKRDEIQRIDATHIIADIAIPNMVAMVKKGIFEILKPLARRDPVLYRQLGEKIDLREYSREKVNDEGPGRFDMEKRKRRLVEVVGDAKYVLQQTTGLRNDGEFRQPIEMLKRILRENIENDDDGKPAEMDRKDKPKDILVSPIDPDARFGAKSKTKKFIGYKAQVTESVAGRFITNIKAMRGNVSDGDTLVDTVLEQKQHGLTPSKVIGDTAYGEGAHRKSLKENGTEMVAPLRTVNTRTRAIFPKSMFSHDEKNGTLTCPQGVTTNESYRDWQKGIQMFHFPKMGLQCYFTAAAVNIKRWVKLLLTSAGPPGMATTSA